jgi:hypothetical protein
LEGEQLPAEQGSFFDGELCGKTTDKNSCDDAMRRVNTDAKNNKNHPSEQHAQDEGVPTFRRERGEKLVQGAGSICGHAMMALFRYME